MICNVKHRNSKTAAKCPVHGKKNKLHKKNKLKPPKNIKINQEYDENNERTLIPSYNDALPSNKDCSLYKSSMNSLSIDFHGGDEATILINDEEFDEIYIPFNKEKWDEESLQEAVTYYGLPKELAHGPINVQIDIEVENKGEYGDVIRHFVNGEQCAHENYSWSYSEETGETDDFGNKLTKEACIKDYVTRNHLYYTK